jgi:hypothetical protein
MSGVSCELIISLTSIWILNLAVSCTQSRMIHRSLFGWRFNGYDLAIDIWKPHTKVRDPEYVNMISIGCNGRGSLSCRLPQPQDLVEPGIRETHHL